MLSSSHQTNSKIQASIINPIKSLAEYTYKNIRSSS